MLRGIHRFEKQIINLQIMTLELMCIRAADTTIRAADTVMSSTKKLTYFYQMKKIPIFIALKVSVYPKIDNFVKF